MLSSDHYYIIFHVRFSTYKYIFKTPKYFCNQVGIFCSTETESEKGPWGYKILSLYMRQKRVKNSTTLSKIFTIQCTYKKELSLSLITWFFLISYINHREKERDGDHKYIYIYNMFHKIHDYLIIITRV